MSSLTTLSTVIRDPKLGNYVGAFGRFGFSRAGTPPTKCADAHDIWPIARLYATDHGSSFGTAHGISRGTAWDVDDHATRGGARGQAIHTANRIPADEATRKRQTSNRCSRIWIRPKTARGFSPGFRVTIPAPDANETSRTPPALWFPNRG